MKKRIIYTLNYLCLTIAFLIMVDHTKGLVHVAASVMTVVCLLATILVSIDTERMKKEVENLNDKP